MKKLIRKLLGVVSKEEYYERVYRENERYDMLMEMLKEMQDEVFNKIGTAPKPRGLKEMVWGIVDYLKLKPKEGYKEVPNEVQSFRTERRFWLEKRKCPNKN
jgi:hypothetical protein